MIAKPPATVALLPVGPGVYRFRAEGGSTLYIGRATNLRSRVASYWGDLGDRQWLAPMVPQIVRIEAVPRTLSGKKLEVPVKKILMGGDPEKAASRDSLANPEALDWFVRYASSGPTDSSSRSSSAPQKS